MRNARSGFLIAILCLLTVLGVSQVPPASSQNGIDTSFDGRPLATHTYTFVNVPSIVIVNADGASFSVAVDRTGDSDVSRG